MTTVFTVCGNPIVERAYREFRNEPPDAPWDSTATFDAIYQVAKAKGIEAEF
ncbi:MAG: hypothetical protein MUC43_15255 [Pirellula sp.]|jgi:hypothetical protein|nr:hypothetical protein [Pirellula sp.]